MSRINTNVSSLIAQTTLTRSNASLQTSLNRLSTGLKINSGKDDPAGLIASENLRRDITAANKAITNTERANQLISTADSALGQVSNLLNDIRGLVTEAANTGVLSDEQIAANQLQVDSSLEAIDRIAQVTTFQGRKLLDGSLDFATSITAGNDTISDLKINKANLGTTGSLSVDVEITAAATQALLTNDSFTFTAGDAAAGSITFTDITTPAVQSSGDLTLTGGAITVEAAADGLADGAIGDDVAIEIQDAADIAGSAATVSLATTGVDIDISTVTGGAHEGSVGDGITVDFAAGGSTGAAYASGTLTVTVATGATSQDIIDAINAVTDFSATLATGTGTEVYDTGDDGTALATFAGGVDGTGEAVYDEGTNTITVSRAVGDTLGDLSGYIDALDDFTSTTADTLVAYDAADNGSFTPLTGGEDAVADDDVISIEANSSGLAFNGTVTFAASSTVAADGVEVSLVDGDITVTVNDSSTYDLADLADAIQAELTDYTVTLSTNDSDGSFDSAADTGVAANLIGGTEDTSSGLADDLVLKLNGNSGSEVFSFDQGTTLLQVVDAVNLVSDSTGIEAVNNAGVLELKSTAYGSHSLVDAEVISEGSAGTFGDGLSGTRASGTDIEGTINGLQANGDGNKISISSSQLDFELTLSDGSDDAVSFDITDGGALFQLGPNVVSNQQARVGISSVSTAKLGGTSGRLYELRSGNAADLASDTTTAAQIVDEAITKVTSLRGRLGAFQRTTLETNIASLQDTISNLTDAQSSIRDADFASETANLTRAQILVQSGTAILQIANSRPQSVLSLLRG